MESAISELSSASMDPSTASCTAAEAMKPICPESKLGITKLGSPAGMFPMRGASTASSIEPAVTTTRATSVAGITVVTFGSSWVIARVTRPSSATGHTTPLGSRCSVDTMCHGSEDGATIPAIGNSCCRMMMLPIPLMKPAITG